MEIGPIVPVNAVDKALEAWAAAWAEADPANAAVVGEAADTMLAEAAMAAGGAEPDAPLHMLPTHGVQTAGDAFIAHALAEPVHAQPVSEPALPGIDADTGHEAATVQTLVRPAASHTGPTPASENARGIDHALPSAQHAHSEFALPGALLVPVALTGLQVEPSTAWPLPRRSEPERPRRAADQERPAPLPPFDEEGAVPADEHTHVPVQQRQADRGTGDDLIFDAADAVQWCEALTRTLREAIASHVVPQALLAAAEQWRRGRCVVLACPQGHDAAAAWAFVLWPRAEAGTPVQPAQDAAPLDLFGLRVEARLQWRTLPPAPSWCHMRVIKEHHPRRGRQLVSPDAESATVTLPCEVQLGPVLERSLRWCEVRVHIQAAQRFWAALGRQWSVHVVVSALPLVGARMTSTRATI